MVLFKSAKMHVGSVVLFVGALLRIVKNGRKSWGTLLAISRTAIAAVVTPGLPAGTFDLIAATSFAYCPIDEIIVLAAMTTLNPFVGVLMLLPKNGEALQFF